MVEPTSGCDVGADGAEGAAAGGCALEGAGSGAGRVSDGRLGLSGGDGSLDAGRSPPGIRMRVGEELLRRFDRLEPLPMEAMFCCANHSVSSEQRGRTIEQARGTGADAGDQSCRL